ncbi:MULTISPECIES: hypothetical protein [unclassified Nostoc]|nr:MULTISPECIES: hypothetical protein [unclassified Nostoc]MDZ8124800.1 hypothetical protein [Nostoc sp. CmiVER01]MDZ8223793.1 hypothetical protein [Nostoc sp. ChiVER01]
MPNKKALSDQPRVNFFVIAVIYKAIIPSPVEILSDRFYPGKPTTDNSIE